MNGKIIKTFISKKGHEVVFRLPLPEDFAAIWGYACDLAAEDTFVEISGPPPTEEEERKWFDEVLESIARKNAIYIHVWVGNQLAGSGRVIRGKYRHAHVGHVGISLSPAYRDGGIGTELFRTLIDQARALGLHILELSCYENNPRALHMYEKLGFKTIGIMPGAVAWKGGYVGEVKMYLPL